MNKQEPALKAHCDICFICKCGKCMRFQSQFGQTKVVFDNQGKNATHQNIFVMKIPGCDNSA